jgi:DNA modification methylase
MLSVYQGDCLDVMEWMPNKSVQCCVTSPPYFGLRDYGHEGQIGLEQTPEQYVAKMVAVFREVRRLLRDDGTLWLNLGDSYARKGGDGAHGGNTALGVKQSLAQRRVSVSEGLKHKDLIGIPWRVAFALQADGWYLRQDIIWRKPNPMPESVTDRCTKSHEYIFLMSKGPRYFFDHGAIKEPSVYSGLKGQDSSGFKNAADFNGKHRAHPEIRNEKARKTRDTFKRSGSKRARPIPGHSVGTHRENRAESEWDTSMRNKRSVWDVATRPYKGAHFATFPPALIEPCILAGSRPGDVVFDPFGGSGTTALVALQHKRKAVLSEINPDYIRLIKERTQHVEKRAATADENDL